MKSTYKHEDVTLLLKDITGLVTPLDSSQREKFIQSGVHYCEMLPLEKSPSPQYLAAYRDALKSYSDITAKACGICAEKIYRRKQAVGETPVIVSLARAGTSVGVLIKRYLQKKYGAEIPHYTISIIRGRGIDKNAVDYILKRHSPEAVQFVDGWTGKGAITSQLKAALKDYPQLDDGIAVLSDPAWLAEVCGTHEDFLIPCSCLNSTVSGLISRTFLRSDIIGEKDFHGAMYYSQFENEDYTYEFIDTVESKFDFDTEIPQEKKPDGNPIDEVREIAERFGIDDINLVKPSIGEATRVLLRRVPWKILVKSLDDNKRLGHIYRLAREKGVAVEEYPLKHYNACGLILKLPDN